MALVCNHFSSLSENFYLINIFSSLFDFPALIVAYLHNYFYRSYYSVAKEIQIILYWIKELLV